MPERVILHLDMDAFYAAVEVRENPKLGGKPLIIGRRGRRGVVSTCSYEARRFGVHSAMPSVTAERLCPDAVWISGRMSLYIDVSREIREIMRDFSPLIEPLSIDEAFIDLTGIACDLTDGAVIARRLKERIHQEQSLTASVGVAPNKFLAKVASDLEKPDGLVVIPASKVPDILWPLPVSRLWGVGPRTQERLARGKLNTIGELAQVPLDKLSTLVGETAAAHLSALAQGNDDRPVEAEQIAKSISEERTYTEDLTDPEEIYRELLARAEGVARELRRKGRVGRTVQLKVRTGDFTTWTRSCTLAEPTDLTGPIVATARTLLRERIDLGGKGVRLLGVGMSGLEAAGGGQGTLFEDPDEDKVRRVTRAADAVRKKLGEDALTRARLVRPRPDRKDLPPSPPDGGRDPGRSPEPE